MQAEDLTGAQAEFFNMLEAAGVKASAQWAEVSAHFANDPRFTAVAADDRLMLFRSYIRMLHEMKDLRLDPAEQEFVVRPPPTAPRRCCTCAVAPVITCAGQVSAAAWVPSTTLRSAPAPACFAL